MALYNWYCVVAVDLTFQPAEGWPFPPSIFPGYRNSHVRFDCLGLLDCMAAFRVIGRDHLQSGETGPVEMKIFIPADSRDGLDDAPGIGGAFFVLEAGHRIAAGTITALLEPLEPLPA